MKNRLDPHYGLPEPLPPGEQIIWQGAPDWHALARSAFHTRALTLYFGVVLALRAVTAWDASHSALATLQAALWLLPLPVLAIGVLLMMAWLTARTTVYTLTSRRIVMHIGVVLDLSLNLPLERLASASLRVRSDGTGDIPLALLAPNKIAYAHLWPHARPWRLAQPEPMLRAIPDAAGVGRLIADAMAAHLPTPHPAPARVNADEHSRQHDSQLVVAAQGL